MGKASGTPLVTNSVLAPAESRLHIPTDMHLRFVTPRFASWPCESGVCAPPAGLVARPTCINKFVIKNLLRHQQPRRIFLIVADLEACQEHLGSISLIVRCIQEDSLVPEITKASVTAALESYYPQLQGDEYLKGRTLSGWYLQQVCIPATFLAGSTECRFPTIAIGLTACEHRQSEHYLVNRSTLLHPCMSHTPACFV